MLGREGNELANFVSLIVAAGTSSGLESLVRVSGLLERNRCGVMFDAMHGLFPTANVR